MTITIKDLAKQYIGKGYKKITVRTIRYYLYMGLLPKPMKRYDKGVKLFFNKKDTMLRMDTILNLKKNGYSLEEIKQKLAPFNDFKAEAASQMEPLLDYLLKRLEAPGNPGQALRASEFLELCQMVREIYEK